MPHARLTPACREECKPAFSKFASSSHTHTHSPPSPRLPLLPRYHTGKDAPCVDSVGYSIGYFCRKGVFLRPRWLKKKKNTLWNEGLPRWKYRRYTQNRARRLVQCYTRLPRLLLAAAVPPHGNGNGFKNCVWASYIVAIAVALDPRTPFSTVSIYLPPSPSLSFALFVADYWLGENGGFTTNHQPLPTTKAWVYTAPAYTGIRSCVCMRCAGCHESYRKANSRP